MIELAPWWRVTGAVAAVLLIPTICVVCRVLDAVESWWVRRPRRWRAGRGAR